MAQQIQLRHDTAANWTSANPTLAVAEMGIETDTARFKLGDGATAWASLAYATPLTNPLTTKGDLLGYSTLPARIPVGTDGQVPVADATQTNGLAWKTLQQGAKNYIVYNNFENNSTTGWSATGCATVTNGLPVTVGSGAAAFSSSNGGRTKNANTAAPAIDSSSAVSGTYALNLATTGAGAIGDGYISSAYTIDKSDQAKCLSFRLSYKVASGTPIMAGTSANTYAVAIYDVANNAWLGVAGAFNFTQSTGVGIATGTFQTASNTTSIQIFIYSPVAPTGASSLLIDDVYVGPQVTMQAPAMSDWTTYTMTITGATSNPAKGTVSFDVAQWRRVGDSIQIRYNLWQNGAGSAGSGTYLFALPAGVTIDTTKIQATTSETTGSALGAATMYNGTSVSNGNVSCYDSTHLKLDLADGSLVGSGSYALSGANIRYAFEVIVPVVGWSSNSVASSDTDTRVVAAKASAGTTGSFTTATIIQFNTVNNDPTGSVTTGAAWKFTAPVTGFYKACGLVIFSSTSLTAGQSQSLALYKNGSSVANIGYTACQTTGSYGFQMPFSTGIYLNAGDYIDVRASSSVSTTINSAADTAIYIERTSGPAVVTATESVNGRYFSSTATITSSDSTVSYSTKDFDSHAAYASGTLTVPVSGKYQINAALGVTATFSLGSQSPLSIYRNGVLVSQTDLITGGSQGAAALAISDVVSCLTGDLITIKVSTNATTPSVTASTTRNYFSWTRVGN